MNILIIFQIHLQSYYFSVIYTKKICFFCKKAVPLRKIMHSYG